MYLYCILDSFKSSIRRITNYVTSSTKSQKDYKSDNKDLEFLSRMLKKAQIDLK